MGLLTQSSIVNCNKFKEVVDYDTVRAFKEPYFIRAFKAFKRNTPITALNLRLLKTGVLAEFLDGL